MIRGGKNEKLRPRDVAGALSAVMDFNEIGTIEIQDRYTVVTILNHDSSISDLLNPNERIQNIVNRYKSGELQKELQKEHQ